MRCFPRKELSREKASGVREANSSKEEEGAPHWGLRYWLFLLRLGASGRGEGRGGGEEDGSWADSGRLAGGKPGGSTGTGRLVAGESRPPGGRMLSLAMVAWMELMGTSPPRTRSWES